MKEPTCKDLEHMITEKGIHYCCDSRDCPYKKEAMDNSRYVCGYYRLMSFKKKIDAIDKELREKYS